LINQYFYFIEEYRVHMAYFRSHSTISELWLSLLTCGKLGKLKQLLTVLWQVILELNLRLIQPD